MRIIVVEDNTNNLTVLCAIISRLPGIECQGFSDPRMALEDVHSRSCDLIVVDYVMPEIDGLQFVRTVRALVTHAHVPVIMVTADDDRATRLAAVNAGVTDFVNKPINPIELKARVSNLLRLRGAQNALAERADTLAQEVARATQHLQAREEEVITRLVRTIEFRDSETSEHVARVAQMAQIIAEELGQSAAYARTLFLAAPLHDVGKIGVPDAALNKPGRLDRAELIAMRRHVEVGEQILANGNSDLMQMAAEVAASHHERWDGGGYPRGLEGEAIPLSARIIAVADVFDALCSSRAYKPAWPIIEARAEILRCAGTQFDPACVEAFARGWGRIEPLFRSRSVTSAA